MAGLRNSGSLTGDALKPGLHEALLTRRLESLLAELPEEMLLAEVAELRDAEASDRMSRHLATMLARAIERAPEGKRSEEAVRIAAVRTDEPLNPGRVLVALLQRLPDGRPQSIERPLTPLLDTTVFTNAPGEPRVGHELRAEVPSADAIDVVMAFVRWSGVQSLTDALRRHCEAGKPLRVLTTTYTNSTEQRALDELERLGAQIKVSYDTSSTRLHAKAWIFHRESGYSTAYIGSSNLTYSAQVLGLEWNVRVSARGIRIRSQRWRRSSRATGRAGTSRPTTPSSSDATPKSPEPMISRCLVQSRSSYAPFQEALLEHIVLARHQGHHRNLLVAATGTGKTVMAAVDYVRLRGDLGRSRLLFVAHREEIIDQSRATFRHALRDAAFGEKWVGGQRPERFEHVFASIQSPNSADVQKIDPAHFDVVIVDEFHHAAAPSYEALLNHLSPVELLGLTATPERSDGLDVLRYFDGRIATELRLWDAIDQEYLAPFAYFGVHDGLDLRDIPWRRGQGYDVSALEGVLTADHAWAHLVVEEIRRKIADPSRMRALGYCVN
jgi:HKD family nuclease